MLQQGSNNAAARLQQCCSKAPTMLQQSSNNAAARLQQCCSKVPTMLQQGSNNVATRLQTLRIVEHEEETLQAWNVFGNSAKEMSSIFVRGCPVALWIFAIFGLHYGKGCAYSRLPETAVFLFLTVELYLTLRMCLLLALLLCQCYGGGGGGGCYGASSVGLQHYLCYLCTTYLGGSSSFRSVPLRGVSRVSCVIFL